MHPPERLTWRSDEKAIAMSRPRANEKETSFAQISAANFAVAVANLAHALPKARYVVNLIQNRYLFSVGFCATIARGMCNLLPQNSALETQKKLLESYPEAILLHDGGIDLLPGTQAVNSRTVPLEKRQAETLPVVAQNHLCAMVFTSGSTGVPKANLKSWSSLVQGSAGNFRHMQIAPGSTLLATVPPQHMWGLETSVLLPLFFNLAAVDSKPLFPADIAQQLAQMNEPRVLISTPVHLRALLRAGVTLPKVDRVLCATAPLSTELAQQIEHTFATKVVEIYGCSEIGSVALRETAREEAWQLFTHLSPRTVGDEHWISADYLPEPVQLQDRLRWLDGNRFILEGRGEDLMEVAGKRGSLQELNHILLSISGVSDGVIFIPPADDADGEVCVRRPAAIVVAQNPLTREELQRHFLKHVDPVFIPRPIVYVDRIPRSATGKIQRSTLLELWSQR